MGIYCRKIRLGITALLEKDPAFRGKKGGTSDPTQRAAITTTFASSDCSQRGVKKLRSGREGGVDLNCRLGRREYRLKGRREERVQKTATGYEV